jgi:hypothetical protein
VPTQNLKFLINNRFGTIHQKVMEVPKADDLYSGKEAYLRGAV